MADGRQQPRLAACGRAYLTTSRFLNAQQGAYAESLIWLSYSDDGGITWSTPKEISGSHPSCTFQSTGSGTDCDEDQFSIPEVAPNGDLYVHFLNGRAKEAPGRSTSTSTTRSWSPSRPTAARASARPCRPSSSKTGSATRRIR